MIGRSDGAAFESNNSYISYKNYFFNKQKVVAQNSVFVPSSMLPGTMAKIIHRNVKKLPPKKLLDIDCLFAA